MVINGCGASFCVTTSVWLACAVGLCDSCGATCLSESFLNTHVLTPEAGTCSVVAVAGLFLCHEIRLKGNSMSPDCG